jgi:alpha-galactosidase/6-phospho-beta-glucosidase family protein
MLKKKKKSFILIFSPKLDADKRLKSKDFENSGVRNIGIVHTTFLYTFLHEKHKDLVPKLEKAIREVKAGK